MDTPSVIAVSFEPMPLLTYFVLMIPVLNLLLEALGHSIACRAELRIIANMIIGFSLFG